MGPQKAIVVGKKVLIDDIIAPLVVSSLESFSLLHTRINLMSLRICYGPIIINYDTIIIIMGTESSPNIIIKEHKVVVAN